MTIRTKIILGFSAIILLGLGYLFYWLVEDLEPQFRKSTEEPLIDSARVLAALASTHYRNNKFDVSGFERAYEILRTEVFEAPVYDFTKTRVDVRTYITDQSGKVIFDSSGRDLGEDFSVWRDVSLTLAGQYGARTTRDGEEPTLSTMYVGAPIKYKDQIVGVLSVGKPTTQANRFTEEARLKLIVGLTLLFVALIVVGALLSRWITDPISRLTEYAREIRDGRRAVLGRLGSGEIAELGVAFEQMRESLEGKKYIEQYVQNLTHEVKSPVSAIRGAAELLEGDPPAADRARFLRNIQTEARRIQGIVDQLLRLARIESRRGLEKVEEISVVQVLNEIDESFRPLLEERRISLQVHGDETVRITGEAFLMRQALANLVQNSIEFCSAGHAIRCRVTDDGAQVTISVSDNGPGVPEYALLRLCERFYSLPRPSTGKKGTGLGLSFVREVVLLHKGRLELENGSPSGLVVRMFLPGGESV